MNKNSNAVHFQHILRLGDRDDTFDVAAIAPLGPRYSSRNPGVEFTTGEKGGESKKRELTPEEARMMGRALLLAARIAETYEAEVQAAADAAEAECKKYTPSASYSYSAEYDKKMRDWHEHQSREVFLTCVRNAERDEKP